MAPLRSPQDRRGLPVPHRPQPPPDNRVPQDTVVRQLRDHAPETPYDLRAKRMVARQQRRQILGIEPRRDPVWPSEAAQHHRNLPALGRAWLRFRDALIIRSGRARPVRGAAPQICSPPREPSGSDQESWGSVYLAPQPGHEHIDATIEGVGNRGRPPCPADGPWLSTCPGDRRKASSKANSCVCHRHVALRLAPVNVCPAISTTKSAIRTRWQVSGVGASRAIPLSHRVRQPRTKMHVVERLFTTLLHR